VSTVAAATFDPTDPEFRRDPYPTFHRLRAADPVHRSAFGFWVVTRYADAEAVLRDPGFEIAPEAATGRVGADSPIGRLSARSILFTNPPDHTRVRGLVSRAFTPRRVADLRDGVAARCRELLDRVAPAGEMDAIADFAHPLPLGTICDLVGVASADRERVRAWADALSNTVDPVVPPEKLVAINRAVEEMSAHLLRLAAERRRAPRSDLLSVLVEAHDARELDETELLATCVLLLVAGHETTTHLIGNGLLALLRHPDQLARLRGRAELLPSAIEEMLRYDSPVQVTFRWPQADTTIGGRAVAAGERIAILFGAANRDPARFPEPDRFDVERADNRHLAFGGGIHFCMGAALARMQAEVAFGALLERLPRIALQVDEPDWRDTVTLRGVRRLPIGFSR
jgi:hypothetical protein